MIAVIQVDWNGLKAAAQRYLIRYGKCVVWATLFSWLVGSTWRFFLLFVGFEGGVSKVYFGGLSILSGY